MSTKGTQLTPATRRKISLTKQKFSKEHLIEAYDNFITHLQDNPKELPTLAGYCLLAGINRHTLLDYCGRYSEVQAITDHIELMQEHFALTRGISNQANPIFSIFLLKTKHNYQDKPQQLTQNNNFNISSDVLKQALIEMNSQE